MRDGALGISTSDASQRDRSLSSGLLGAGAYIAAINNWPVLSPILYWVALQTYEIAVHWIIF